MKTKRQYFHSMAMMAALIAALPSAVMAAPPLATVQVATGQVTVRRVGAKAPTPLAARAALHAGDVVQTGPNGKVAVLFTDGSQARLNANAALEVTPRVKGKKGTSLFKATAGEVWSRLRPGKVAQARGAIAAVRGTEFVLAVADDDTVTLTVMDGEVDFSNEHGGVMVGESQQSVARPGAAPTAPVTIGNAGMIIEWTLELDRALIPRETFYVSPDREAVKPELQRRSEAAKARPEEAGTRRDYGDALFDAGRYDDALKEYQEADRSAPNQPATLTRLGNAQLELDRLADAEGSFTAALQTDARYVPALSGLASLALVRNRPAEAEQFAQRAVAADARSVNAQIALGLARMRQPGKLAQAQEAFQAATTGDPTAVRYQALSWLALVHSAQEDHESALREAHAAIASAPQSALARGNAALVSFFAGKPREAEREARTAARLSPNSVAAQCAVAQSLLAAGDVDGAVAAAAKAVALDPSLPQARYLLGLADAQRRDYRHSARELQECLKLAPDFLPAASALARVYTAMGRKDEAVAVLTDLVARHRDPDQVQAALGSVYYQQGRYAEAETQYRDALKGKPNSALYHSELSRVLLDANRLNEAIETGQQAVRLAPGVGQYHAVLGLAYSFSRMNIQAEREFREAISLDPRNALALVQLGLKAAQFDPREQRLFPKAAGLSLEDLLKQGLQGTNSSQAVSTLTQGFLYDPAISTQVLRGGVDLGVTVGAGNDSQQNASLTHRSVERDGAAHTFASADYATDDGMRANDDTTAQSVSGSMTLSSDPRTTVFARVSHRRTRQGMPGSLSAPDLDDREQDRGTLLQLAGRHRLGRNDSLWFGLSRPTQSLTITNTDRDASAFVPTPDGNGVTLGMVRQEMDFSALVPEVRYERAVGEDRSRPAILALGLSYADLSPDYTMHLFYPSDPPVTVPLATRLDGKLSIGYAELTQRLSQRLSYSAQLRSQRLNVARTVDYLGGGAVSASESESRWLPSLIANYRAGDRTLLRLLMNRQVQQQELVPLALRPMGALLCTEPLVMPKGSPDESRTVELDVERHLGGAAFLKLFVFRTTATDVDFGDLPTMQRVEREGWGLRYERGLSRNLYGQLGLLVNDTTNQTQFAPFDRGTAPYNSARVAGLTLNYIDSSGTKVGLQVNYTGKFYQDTGIISAPVRPIFPARTYVDLTLAKEPNLQNEFFVKVTNLFNADMIQFNDYPTGGRRVQVGWTRRW